MLPKPAPGHPRTLPERRRYGRKQRQFLQSLVSDAVIEEHRLRPPPERRSEALRRLLFYFRRKAQTDGYVVLVVKPFAAYRIVERQEALGLEPKPLDHHTYASQDAADHALFVRRIRDLVEA